MKVSHQNVDEYISSFPKEIQKILSEIREIIKTAAPGSEESISYGMPAYKLYNKPLVYFAAQKNHIGFYATPTGHTKFAKELSAYKQGKGSVQFPIKNDIPYALIERITRFRVEENRKRINK
jgi:uncharacterized protein YdhG (YjbR/CyaY superfamily)